MREQLRPLALVTGGHQITYDLFLPNIQAFQSWQPKILETCSFARANRLQVTPHCLRGSVHESGISDMRNVWHRS